MAKAPVRRGGQSLARRLRLDSGLGGKSPSVKEFCYLLPRRSLLNLPVAMMLQDRVC